MEVMFIIRVSPEEVIDERITFLRLSFGEVHVTQIIVGDRGKSSLDKSLLIFGE